MNKRFRAIKKVIDLKGKLHFSDTQSTQTRTWKLFILDALQEDERL